MSGHYEGGCKMQPDLSLQDLTRRVLEEIRKFDLSYNTISFYRQAYGSIQKFAVEQGIDSYSDSLVLRFLGYIDQKHRDGKLWDSRRDLLRRAALLLKDYATDQSIEYKRYKFINQPMPSSIEFLHYFRIFLTTFDLMSRKVKTPQIPVEMPLDSFCYFQRITIVGCFLWQHQL